jgi:hypothetical protein
MDYTTAKISAIRLVAVEKKQYTGSDCEVSVVYE